MTNKTIDGVLLTLQPRRTEGVFFARDYYTLKRWQDLASKWPDELRSSGYWWAQHDVAVANFWDQVWVSHVRVDLTLPFNTPSWATAVVWLSDEWERISHAQTENADQVE